MSPRRRKQTSWGAVIIVGIIGLILFLMLPKWLQILIFIFVIIALVEAVCQAFLGFSLLKRIWDKIF